MRFAGESNTIPFPLPTRTDGDTPGGRLWRARDAIGLSLSDIATHLGLPQDMVEGWECDRAEPEANALATLASLLSVSPSWLIAGVGKAPFEPSGDDNLHPVVQRLEEVQKLHDQTGKAIAALEAEVARLLPKDRG